VSGIVLYVEDEESDRFLVQHAFAREGSGSALRMVAHGQAAIDYLSGTGSYSERDRYPLPGVVLLDLNLPGVPGFEVLEWIRAQPAHASLPVVIFTSSGREEDRNRARLLGATDFLQKPASLSGFQHIARKLLESCQALGELTTRLEVR
jgi:CheY-like chemotaxis protein